ncbi:MAG: AMP-binding protein [Acidimicrobiales bacterium]
MTERVDPVPRVVPDLLRQRRAEDPEGTALVVDGGEGLDYATWDRRSSSVARGLVARGVRRGDRVALLFDNDGWTDYAVCYLGVHKAAGVAVPLSPRFADAELAWVLERFGVSGVLCPPPAAPAVPGGSWWVAEAGDVEQGQDNRAFQATVGPDDLADILCTSGTTGRPKGVACSHANLVFHELPPDRVAAATGGAAIRFLHSFPIGTNAGQEVLRMPLHRVGRTAVALAAFDADRLCSAVATHGITRLQLVPAMAQVLLAGGAHRRHDLSSVERVTLSSAPVPPALLDRLAEAFPRAVLCNAYALTESGTARTLLVGAKEHPGSVGRPVGATEVRVVDDDGSDVPDGRTGEVWLRRPGAPRRWYYGDPEATAVAFVGDWLRTGDLGHLDGEGLLYLDDRKKDVIISGGANISSVEVENVLYEHPAVAEAAVFGVPHDVLGQDVAVAVVLRTGAEIGVRELQSFVRERLAEHKVPHRSVVVQALPRNASGKVLKRELPALAASVESEGEGVAGAPLVPAPAALSPVERSVLVAWEAALGQDVIGLHDDFFELGGHSLAAAQVAARLQDTFAVELPVTCVFEAPTVAELAVAIERLRGAEA